MISDNAKKTNSLADDIESVLFTEQDLDGIVSKVAKEITEHYYEREYWRSEKYTL